MCQLQLSSPPQLSPSSSPRWRRALGQRYNVLSFYVGRSSSGCPSQEGQSFPCDLLDCFQSRGILWLVPLIGDVLGVDDAVVPINDQDRSRQLPPLFEPHAVVPPELLAAISGECLVQHARSILPTRLRLRQIHTHG